MRRTGLALLFAVVGHAAMAQSPPAGHPVMAVGDAAAGQALAQRWCSSCHVVGDSSGGGTDAAPPMRSVAVRADRDADHFRAFLSRPHGRMPPLQLTRGEIADILAYFRMLAAAPR